jgi:hypothetical protein
MKGEIMPYCPKCGVELDEGLTSCPLCKSPVIGEKDGKENPAGAFPETAYDPETLEGLTVSDRKKVAMEVISVSFAIALAVTVLINLTVNKTVSWSLFPVSSLIFLWVVISSMIVFEGRTWLIYAIIGPSILVFVFCLDVLDGPVKWFLDVGLPLVLVLELVVALTTLFVSLMRRKGMNLIAIILLGINFLCLGIDGVLTHRFGGQMSFGWSVVVSIALVPISAFLFYLHYRITKQASLKKLFRL